MPRRRERAFIWIPKPKDTEYSIEIDGVNVRLDVLYAAFTKSLIGLEDPCKLTLIDADGEYSDKYVGGEVIELKLDFSDGTTSQWKGTLEAPRKRFGDAYTIQLIGSHFQSDLLNITVTEEYTGGTNASQILKEIIDEYLTGFTYTNVLDSNVTPTVKWNNKPFWDCVLDLCNLAEFDGFVDEDKDFHFFGRGSINNDDEALVWDDNLLEIERLGTDTVDIKNRIIVYGEDNTGLAIIYQTDDTSSQSQFGIKELIVRDTSVNTYAQAKELGDAELLRQKALSSQGKAKAIILPDLRLGQMTYIIDPVQKVHDRFKVVQYTHSLPNEQTSVVVTKTATIPTLFKDRKNAELAQENLTNPFKLKNSYNLTFNDLSDIDQTRSSDIGVTESNLYQTGGVTGTMISKVRTSTSDITTAAIKVIGDTIADLVYYLSTDNGTTFGDPVNINQQLTLPAGSNLVVKIIINDTTARLDGISVSYS